MTNQIKALCQKHREPLLYLVFGVLTTAVNYLVYLLCRWALPDSAWRLGVSNAVAWLLSVLLAYSTNRRWVFAGRARGGRAVLREVSAFFAARVFSLLLDMGVLYGGAVLLGWDDRIVKLGSNILVVVVNYFLSKFWVFRRGGR